MWALEPSAGSEQSTLLNLRLSDLSPDFCANGPTTLQPAHRKPEFKVRGARTGEMDCKEHKPSHPYMSLGPCRADSSSGPSMLNDQRDSRPGSSSLPVRPVTARTWQALVTEAAGRREGEAGEAV